MATQDDSKWKVKREISLGDLVAIAVAMGGVILAYGTLDKRISVLEAGAITSAQALADIRDTIREIDRKLTAVLMQRGHRDRPGHRGRGRHRGDLGLVVQRKRHRL